MFENTVVPRDFDEIVVPFPERGEPELVKGKLENGLVAREKPPRTQLVRRIRSVS